MGSNYDSATTSFLILPLMSLLLLFTSSSKAKLVHQQPLILKYHNGTLLKGPVTVNLIWYGNFTPTQRSVIVDFLTSLTSTTATKPPPHPSALSWWNTTANYNDVVGPGPSTLLPGKHLLDQNYSLGKSLKNSHIIHLAAKGTGGERNAAVNVVLTSNDVVVEGFCMNRCGSHGSTSTRSAYAWVGDSGSQCPGYCAWPFHEPVYGPKNPPLLAPNGDVGVDGMVIGLATVLAGAVTNPFNGGYFQGPKAAPLEAVSACAGVFGSGAYPGYAGAVLTDRVTGAGFNAYGVNGRKFLLPAMWDPKTSKCSTLV